MARRRAATEPDHLTMPPRVHTAHEHHKPVAAVRCSVERHSGGAGRLPIPEFDAVKREPDLDALRCRQQQPDMEARSTRAAERAAAAAQAIKAQRLQPKEQLANVRARSQAAREFSARVEKRNAQLLQAKLGSAAGQPRTTSPDQDASSSRAVSAAAKKAPLVERHVPCLAAASAAVLDAAEAATSPGSSAGAAAAASSAAAAEAADAQQPVAPHSAAGLPAAEVCHCNGSSSSSCCRDVSGAGAVQLQQPSSCGSSELTTGSSRPSSDGPCSLGSLAGLCQQQQQQQQHKHVQQQQQQQQQQEGEDEPALSSATIQHNREEAEQQPCVLDCALQSGMADRQLALHPEASPAVSNGIPAAGELPAGATEPHCSPGQQPGGLSSSRSQAGCRLLAFAKLHVPPATQQQPQRAGQQPPRTSDDDNEDQPRRRLPPAPAAPRSSLRLAPAAQPAGAAGGGSSGSSSCMSPPAAAAATRHWSPVPPAAQLVQPRIIRPMALTAVKAVPPPEEPPLAAVMQSALSGSRPCTNRPPWQGVQDCRAKGPSRTTNRLAAAAPAAAAARSKCTAGSAAKVVLPPLCGCGHGTAPSDPAYPSRCCTNCPLYRNPQLWARLLQSLQ